MPGDHSYRTPQGSPRSTATAEETRSPNATNKVYNANVAAGGGNSFAASLAAPAPEEEQGPGFFDKIGAVMGSTHLKKMVGSTGTGVDWDDKEKGANQLSIDVMGKDEMRVPKLRVASLTREGLSAKDIHADDIKLREQDKAKNGNYAAELTAPSAGSGAIKSASPELEAAGIDLGGVKVRREIPGGDELTDFFSQPGDTTVQVDRAAVSGLKAGGVSAGSLEATGVSGSMNADGAQGQAKALTATGLSAGGATVDSAKAKDLTASNKGGIGVGASSVDLQGLAVASARVAKAHADGVKIQSGADGTAMEAKALSASGIDAGGVKIAGASATNGSVRMNQDGTTLAAQSLQGTDIDAGTSGATEAHATDATMRIANGALDVNASALGAKGVRGGPVTLDTATATGASLHKAGTTTQLGAKELAGTGIAAGGVKLKDAGASGANLAIDGANISGGANSIRGSGLTGTGLAVDQLGGSGVTVQSGPGGTSVGAKDLSATQIAAGGLNVDKASAQGASVRTSETGLVGGAAKLGAAGISGKGLSMGSANVTDATMRTGEDGLDLGAATLDASKIVAGGIKVDKGTGSGAKLHAGDSGVSGSAKKLGATGISGDGLSVGSTSATGATFDTAGGLAVGATTVDASKVTAGGVSAGKVNAKGAKLAMGDKGTTVGASSLGASNITAGGLSAKDASVSGLDANIGEGVDASVASGSASGIAYNTPGMRMSAGALGTKATKVKSGKDGTSVNSAGLTGSNVRVDQTKGGSGSASGLTQQVAGLVDTASMKASAPLTGATYGSGTGRVTVKDGTVAYVEVKVSGGKIVPAGTSARFSQPLDTWGWTSVPGIYMSEDGKLYAEVSGMLDKDLTPMVNGVLGREGETLPLGVRDLAGSTGKGGGGGASGVDFGNTKVDATVGLRSGKLATDGMSATLGKGNTGTLSVDGDRSLSVSFSKLILDAFGIQSAGAKVDVKDVAATGASFGSDAGGMTTKAASIKTGAASATVK